MFFNLRDGSLIILTLTLSYCDIATAKNLSAPIVHTKYGALKGKTGQSGEYYTFQSIPYAEPPVGELRFEAPVPHSSWHGLLEATKVAPKCPQWLAVTDPAEEQSEDCLYLNVFVPNASLPNGAGSAALLPVMIFIHGGGLMWGTASHYGEEYIMAHGGLILVTLNHRLGAFGFLSTEDDEIAGNMGFKDQSMALQWVYENIEHFGGDKQQILLTGWSAGATSVHFHMVSAWTSPKWFSSAASFSGTALILYYAVYPGKAYKNARQLAEYLGCNAAELANTKGIKSCLKSQKMSDILQQTPKFYKYFNHPFDVFGPVIENTTATKRFLTAPVETLMKAGHTKAKPWLISRTALDGAFISAEFLKKQKDGHELIADLEDRWLELAPMLLFFNSTWSTEAQQKRALDLKVKYFGTRAIGLDTYHALEDLYNDELSTKAVEQTVELYVNYTANAKAYGYVYDNPPPFGLGQLLAERTDWKFGTLHGDDTALILKVAPRQKHPFRADEQIISRHLIEMLVQMAKNGAPTYDGMGLKELTPSNVLQFTTITKDGIPKSFS